jgi:hypothetical protein
MMDDLTIKENILEPGQFLAIHIGGSESSKTVSGDSIRTKDSEFWFFQIADVASIIQKPIRLYNEAGDPQGPLAADSGINYNQLFDNQGDDALRNDEDDWTVYHFSVGVHQQGIRIYPRVPESQNGGGFTYLSGNEPDPTAPSPYGYVPADQTHVYNPGVELESLAWRSGQRSSHQYGFFNDNEVAIDPVLSVVGAAYNLRPVEGRRQMLNLLADVGRPKSQQENRIHTINFSRSALRSFSYKLPEEWKDSQNTLTVQEANIPEDIERAIMPDRQPPEEAQEAIDKVEDRIEGGET